MWGGDGLCVVGARRVQVGGVVCVGSTFSVIGLCDGLCKHVRSVDLLGSWRDRSVL